MIKIDLITGFLGAGKTTFIKKYAEYLVDSGYHVGIIENDFGAVNIDMLMLQDLLGDRLDVEQIVGGSIVTDWKRRFRTKLISMAMRGFNRIVVEPSGIYDTDAFFDVLREEPIDTWYEAGSIFTIVDAGTDENLSEPEEYLMVSQASGAGKILLSKIRQVPEDAPAKTVAHINRMMAAFRCPRRFYLPETRAENLSSDTADRKQKEDFSSPDCVLAKCWEDLTPEDFRMLSEAGWVQTDHEKLWFDPKKAFSSLFFMNVRLSENSLKKAIEALLSAPECGTVFRIKGYLPLSGGEWLQFNATPRQSVFQNTSLGQEILIVIGQDLQEAAIRPYFFDHVY